MLYSLDLSLPLNPWPFGTIPTPRAAWNLAILLSTPLFPFVLTLVENLPWLYHFLDVHAIIVFTVPPYRSPTQFIWYFWRVLFTLRIRWTYCCATHVIYAIYLLVSFQQLVTSINTLILYVFVKLIHYCYSIIDWLILNNSGKLICHKMFSCIVRVNNYL